DHVPYHDLAPLLVITHDLESYRRHCRDELLQFRQTRDAVTAHRMAKDCLILPDSGADLSAVREWTDTSLSVGAASWARPAFLFTKALADYRTGEFGNAARDARESRDSATNWPDLEVEINALLAMAQFRLGQPIDAHESLIRAK